MEEIEPNSFDVILVSSGLPEVLLGRCDAPGPSTAPQKPLVLPEEHMLLHVVL